MQLFKGKVLFCFRSFNTILLKFRNPKVQLKGLNLSYIQYFLRLLNNEYEDNNMKIRLVFTLSTLLRNFPQGQKVFLDHGGIQVIIKIFDQINSNTKLKIRLIELMNDLIIEKVRKSNFYSYSINYFFFIHRIKLLMIINMYMKSKLIVENSNKIFIILFFSL